MRTPLQTVFLFVFLIITACAEPGATDQETHPAPGVSGTLALHLLARDATGLYVRFELKEQADDGTQVRIAQTGFTPVVEQPVQFSLSYPAGSIRPQNRYVLITTVAEDPAGNQVIARMVSPVLTQGHPSVLRMAIQPHPEPIE